MSWIVRQRERAHTMQALEEVADWNQEAGAPQMSAQMLPDGTVTILEELYGELPFFRKWSTDRAELTIALMLQENPHPNVVNIYQVTDEFYDMELVDPDFELPINEWGEQMQEAKNHLQQLGIIYIDWKQDNTGISLIDGNVKLFDFDSSGTTAAPMASYLWFQEPFEGFRYRDAVAAGMETPFEIDDYAFLEALKE